MDVFAAKSLLLGGVPLGCLAASLFFGKFWRVTADRFFLFFVLSFVVQTDDGPDGIRSFCFIGGNRTTDVFFSVGILWADHLGGRRQKPNAATTNVALSL